MTRDEGYERLRRENMHNKAELERLKKGRDPFEVEKLKKEIHRRDTELQRMQSEIKKVTEALNKEKEMRAASDIQRDLAESHCQIIRTETEKEYSTLLKNTSSAFEAQIAEMKKKNADLEHRIVSAELIWNGRVRDLESDLCSQKEKLDEAERKYDEAKRNNDLLSQENSVLKKELEKYKAAETASRVHKDPSTSSTPSNYNNTGGKKNIPNNRKPSGNPPGAVLGHKGSLRPRLDGTRPDILIDVPDEIRNSDEWELVSGKEQRRSLIDINCLLNVQWYVAPSYRNNKTGKIFTPKFPDYLQNDVNYSSSFKSFLLMLTEYCGVSVRKAQELTSELSNGTLNPSLGFIQGLKEEFSVKSAEERAEYFRNLQNAPFMHVDFTGSRVNSHMKQICVCSNNDSCLYFFRDTKGFKGLAGTPVEGYQFILIHDHDVSFYSFGGGHQECLSHLLRYLLGASVMDPDLKWILKMHNHLQLIIHEYKESGGNLSDERILELEKIYISIIEEGRKEYQPWLENKELKMDDHMKDGFNLWKRFQQSVIENNHLLFLHVKFPELEKEDNALSGCLPWTNNEAELCARGFKRALKAKVTFRSEEGNIYLCDVMSVFRTCIKRGESVMKKGIEIFGRNDIHKPKRATRKEKDREKEKLAAEAAKRKEEEKQEKLRIKAEKKEQERQAKKEQREREKAERAAEKKRIREAEKAARKEASAKKKEAKAKERIERDTAQVAEKMQKALDRISDQNRQADEINAKKRRKISRESAKNVDADQGSSLSADYSAKQSTGFEKSIS